MAVNDTGSKPAGTAPPAGCPPPAVVVVVMSVAGTVVAATAELVGVVVPLPTAELAPDPQPATRTAAAREADDKARKRLLFTDLLTLGQQGGFLGHCLPGAGPPPSRRRTTNAPIPVRGPAGEPETAGQNSYGAATEARPRGCSMRCANFFRALTYTPQFQGSPDHMSDLTPPTNASETAEETNSALSTSPVLTHHARLYPTTWGPPPSKTPSPGRSSSSTTATSFRELWSKSTRTRSCST